MSSGFCGNLDSGGNVGVDLRQGTQKQATDVGEHGGAARRDAVLSQELVEVGEGMVDALGSLEALKFPDEMEEVIVFLLMFLCGAMLRTEAGVGVGSEETALTASRGAMGATKRGGISSL